MTPNTMTTTTTLDIIIFRKGTEGLSTEIYAEKIQDRLPDYSVARARTIHQERELLPDARVATGVSIDEELVERGRNLDLFVAASSGVNHLPLDRLSQRGVIVANAAGIHASGIAEQVLGYCLSFTRRIHEGWRRKRNHYWHHYKAS